MSLRNRTYYALKPLIPALLRWRIRGYYTRLKRKSVVDEWPIKPGSERPPEGWKGWPEGKQFAVVLTHDVEGRSGYEKSLAVAKLEKEMGFRSSFNFIPEGEYFVEPDLREELNREGFEVGVHDLYHDGKLYCNERSFRAHAVVINRYLKEWGAVGFRSGFMMHNLDWIAALDVAYDASTFDTDPFEPQPTGVSTIFPFWKGSEERKNAATRKGAGGYVELPYTLPQDSTLFLLLREKDSSIWKKKIDWLAEQGGMVLLDTHPDYMALEGGCSDRWQYPVKLYRELLEYVNGKFAGRFWHALPREVASFWNRSMVGAWFFMFASQCDESILTFL
jgi:hypothetical protein